MCVAGTGQLSNQIIADLQAFSELPDVSGSANFGAL
jgi:hypothetical protein